MHYIKIVKKDYKKRIIKGHRLLNRENNSKSETAEILEIINYRKNFSEARTNIQKILSSIEYPYAKYFLSEQQLRDNFVKLISHKPKILHDQYNLVNIRLAPEKLKFNGDYYILLDEPSEYPDLELFSDYFNEQCRVECVFSSSKMSTKSYFRNNLPNIINYLEKKGDDVNIKNMREAIWNIGPKECSTFKPKLIKFFIELFNARRILDISSGWGDRLIGVMASDIDCYHGFDPNPCLHQGYRKMIDFFSDIRVNKDAEFIIKELPFEKAELQNSYYDLVMTSPPYFDMEIYDNNSINQSTKDQSEASWFHNYLKVWINICHRALKPGAVIALNINQYRHQNYIYWMLKEMEKNNKWNYLGVISHSNIKKKNPQPTFVWRKI